jgi:PAS domain S-box-containing protein
MYDFIGKKMTLWPLYNAIIVGVASSIIFSFDLSFELKAFLAAVYFGTICIFTGIVFLRNIKFNGFGVWLTGLSLILLGLHGIDFAFLRPIVWFVPWGYLIDAFLRFLIALGTLLVYLEKTRTDLIHSRDCYRLLAENAVDIIYRYKLTPVPGFAYISPSIFSITGYATEDFYADARFFIDIIHPSDREGFETFLRSPIVKMPPLTLRLIPKDGKEIWIEQTSVPGYDANGNINAIEGVIRDITMRRQLEQDMARMDSLNTIGQMAANLAHEIRNPMTTIRGYLQMLARRPEFACHEERFDLMIGELDRANAIISEYLSLCKNKVVDMKAYNLDRIVHALFPLLQADANASNCQVTLSLEETPQIYLDEKEIRQLILNLVRNGLEAMTSCGMLTIRTYARDKYVVLAIQDQGGGIPPHVLENLGTPFVTTKETGTGLGLAVCYTIANRHQAEIKVETSNEGTTFYVHFPLNCM